MAESLKIKGGTTVDLLQTAGISIMGWTPETPQNEDNLHEVVRENMSFRIKGTSQNDLASQLIIFKKELRKARQFHTTTWQTTPLYIEAQGSTESNTRYALLHRGRVSNLMTIHKTVAKNAFTQDGTLELWREAGWRDAVPGVYPSAVTLAASDGPANPTLVHISNHTDDHAITHIFAFDDSGGSYSANNIGSSEFDLFTNPAGVNDIVYVGSTIGPFHTAVFNTGTASQLDNGNWDYWNGAWIDITTQGGGDKSSAWPNLTDDQAIVGYDGFWKSAGQIVLNISNVGDWVVTTINGVEAFWVRFEWTSGASDIDQTGQVVYAQRKNYIEIPATAIDGDLPPHTLMAFGHPTDNGATPDFRTTSRIVMGARSNPGAEFTPNIVFDQTAMNEYWAQSALNALTDASAVADEDAPAGTHIAVTFATTEPLTKRVTMAEAPGTDILLDYVGIYRVFIICQQINGDAGDTSVQFVFSDAFGVSSKSEEVSLSATDAGLEVVDVGALSIPATQIVAGDDLVATADLSNSFDVYAARSTGAGTMRIYEIFLLPIEEWSATLNSPIIDTALALELFGRQRLEVDSGILRPRTMRTAEDYTTNIANQIPVGNWELHGKYPILEPSTKYRIYFKLMNYNAAVGTGPFLAPLGKHLAIELRTVDRYATLRGGD